MTTAMLRVVVGPNVGETVMRMVEISNILGDPAYYQFRLDMRGKGEVGKGTPSADPDVKNWVWQSWSADLHFVPSIQREVLMQ